MLGGRSLFEILSHAALGDEAIVVTALYFSYNIWFDDLERCLW